MTALLLATLNSRDTVNVNILLNDARTSVLHARDNDGNTALMLAANNDDVRVVKSLLTYYDGEHATNSAERLCTYDFVKTRTFGKITIVKIAMPTADVTILHVAFTSQKFARVKSYESSQRRWQGHHIPRIQWHDQRSMMTAPASCTKNHAHKQQRSSQSWEERNNRKVTNGIFSPCTRLWQILPEITVEWPKCKQ